MGWFASIKDEWKSAGIITRVSWLFGIIWPLATAAKDGWKMPTYDLYSILNFLLYLLLVTVVILNARMRRERNLEINKSEKLANALHEEQSENAKIAEQLKIERKNKDKLQEALDNLNSERGNEELEMLIKPLYCEFDKYRYASKKHRNGLAYALSAPTKWLELGDDFKKSIGVDRTSFVLGLLQNYGDLAQPELQKLIHQYLELEQTRRDPKKLYSDQDVRRIEDVVIQIDTSVKTRYNELMWKDERS